ncbi:MAG: tryptophan synthase subunit alpha [Phycisphaerae bacterium]|nr:tryptophan synthase subunit alpha [Phycisphaerae bacterium]
MGELDKNRIVQAFAALRSVGKKALVPFITAGYPDLESTLALLADFQARGVRVCELGIPFSDPIADGPVIQNSYTQALAAGITSDKIMAAVRTYRAAGGGLALAAMVSYSIVFRHDVRTYLDDLAKAGFDAVIIPDLSLEEAATTEPAAAAAGLCLVMLIAPTTPPPRRLEIARHSRGFVYFISVAGITGERHRLPQPTITAVAELRKEIDTPICVGFGISRPEMVSEVCRVADGAIVGSAIVARLAAAKGTSRDKLVKEAGEFVSQLLQAIR